MGMEGEGRVELGRDRKRERGQGIIMSLKKEKGLNTMPLGDKSFHNL